MIDHFEFGVENFDDCVEFYSEVVILFGGQMVCKNKNSAGFGYPGEERVIIFIEQVKEKSGKPIHFCFQAGSKTEVDEFYSRAINAGGKDNGEPGPRPDFGNNYYAAFVYDPDGNNIEAVYRGNDF